MGSGFREVDDSYECTVGDAHFMIHNCILFNPKNGLHFRVMGIDFDDDSCSIQCIETEVEHIVMLEWLKNWKIL